MKNIDNINIPKLETSFNWKESLAREFKIICIETINQISSILGNCLWTISCSLRKSNLKKTIPEKLYISKINQFFYRYMKKYKLPYATLSDKYGLIFSNEKVENYDLHPSNLTNKDFINLGKQLQEKFKSINFSTIIFYGKAPLMNVPYFKMLYYSKIPSFYLRNLHLLDELFIYSKQRQMF